MRSGARLAKSEAPAWVCHTCPFCETKGGAYVVHYDIVHCRCGNYFWALRPMRGGPLQFFPYPGESPRATELKEAA